MRLKLTNALCFFGLLVCSALASRAQNPNPTGAGHCVRKGELDPARLAALPIDANGAIYYEGVIKADSTISKQDIHQAVREWFVSNYVSGKDGGKILGKGIYKYQFVNGINISEGVQPKLSLRIRNLRYDYYYLHRHEQGRIPGISRAEIL